MAMTTQELLALNDRIGNALARHLEPIFKPGVKLTLIARTPGNNEADVLVSAESDLQDVMDLITCSMSRNVIGWIDAAEPLGEPGRLSPVQGVDAVKVEKP
jgi:hypothetical protein